MLDFDATVSSARLVRPRRALLPSLQRSYTPLMTENAPAAQEPPFRAVLTPHRSLGPKGFLLLMTLFGAVCFATGMVFYLLGAWPVLGFLGLDVLLLYVAFKLNYRAGRASETIEIGPRALTLTRVHPSGRRETFQCSPYYARVHFHEWPDGRTTLDIAAKGDRMALARFLNDAERRDLADALEAALLAARGGPRI